MADPGSLLAGAPKIVVLRALRLGDMLCAVPALRALRAAAPQADITLISLPWASIVARRFPDYIDRFQHFPGFPGMPERPPDLAAIPPFIAAMQAARFDLAIQLHGSGEVSNILTALLGATRMAGHRRTLPVSHDATSHWRDWQDDAHEILRCLALMDAIGAAPVGGGVLEFPVTQTDQRLLERTTGILSPSTRLAVLHPGASLSTRRWPAQRFAEVGDALTAAGLSVALTGTVGETALCREVAQHMRMPAQNLAGRTELGPLAALLRVATVVVCNDTGVAHLARAVGTPTVTICCGADPRRFAPLDPAGLQVDMLGLGRHRLLWTAVACRPCMETHCPIAHPCATGVTVEAVLAAVRSLLESSVPAHRSEAVRGAKAANAANAAEGADAPDSVDEIDKGTA